MGWKTLCRLSFRASIEERLRISPSAAGASALVQTGHELSVRAPKFDLYEMVTLSWNEQSRQGKVVKRWLDLNDELWFYQLAGIGTDRLFPEDALDRIVQPQLSQR